MPGPENISAPRHIIEKEKWPVPLSIGAGRVFRMGKLPNNVQMGYYNYVVSPDNGPAWQLRAQVSLLFPK